MSPEETRFDPKRFLPNLSTNPGVYQMYDANGKVLYVGKAKNLKNRVSSYFRNSGLAPKTEALVKRIHNVQVTVTQSEMEALILEQNLIKSQRPPYNILLRDDKSYPYIFLSSGEDYPRIAMHRGAKKRKGQYFGPYPGVGAVRDSMNFLQKTFRVRQCEDSVFRNRSRPCLQYQINRCTAPCVNLISPEDYAEDVRHTEMFLTGRNTELTRELANQMEAAAEAQDYERAAVLRDQISALRSIQAQQFAEADSGELDVMALARQGDSICVHVLYVRQGRILGSRSYYYQEKLPQSDGEFLADFMPQFYLGARTREIPPQIVVSAPIEEHEKGLLQDALKTRRNRNVSIASQVRGARQKWLELAERAARENLGAHEQSQQSMQRRFEALRDVLDLDETPGRLECFDISHSSGEETVASCVVFDQGGPVSSDYRRFNIKGVTPGDDYAAMEQAISRRYTRIQKGEGVLPDILLIDGGKGQLNAAKKVLAELGVNDLRLLGVAKGTTRKAGFETLFLDDAGNARVIPGDSPALHLIQAVRDESHRFAITGHKNRRDKKRRTSLLEDIPGVGAKRRRELLRHFGGMQEVRKASVDELAKVPSISKKIAEDIYSSLHN
ncbi:excinuclease ABC subunit UvrC [Gilvimarinus sp. F26214L]|uniref:excinuclease ABC subunit UvrC n=1 Tax=Gilvimarinus sp. DZF01 TaxID=3461371 RepID=UPI0040455D49